VKNFFGRTATLSVQGTDLADFIIINKLIRKKSPSKATNAISDTLLNASQLTADLNLADFEFSRHWKICRAEFSACLNTTLICSAKVCPFREPKGVQNCSAAVLSHT
jgi:hypothetical protein